MKATSAKPARKRSSAPRPPCCKSVLAGLSLGESDGRLLEYLGFLAQHLGFRRVRCLHVIPGIYLFDRKEGLELTAFEKSGRNGEIAGELAGRLSKALPPGSGFDIKVEVRDGDPLEEFLLAARESKADLAVLGKATDKERHGILARNLVRKLGSGALFVPDLSRLRLRHILVPVDFSPNSILALQKAVEWQQRFKPAPRVTALNVCELPPFPSYLIRKTEEEIRGILFQDRAVAFQSFLATALREGQGQDVKIEILEQRHAGTGELLMEYALANHCDLIVMGAKGHSRASLLLLGSVTEKVLGLTRRIPVLVVK